MKKKSMKHKTNRYDARRKCKVCKEIIARGTQHIHNRVRVGKFLTSRQKGKKR